MSQVLSSETGMPLTRIPGGPDCDGELKVLVHWKGLSSSVNTLGPLKRVNEEVPKMAVRLERKETSAASVAKGHRALGLYRKGV